MVDRAATTTTRPLPLRLIAAVFVPVIAAAAWILRDAEGFRFAHPGALALIPLAVALVLWTAFRRPADRHPALRYPRASELGARPPGLVARLRDLPVVLRLLSIALLGVALARPQTSRAGSDIELEGIDIVIALVVSGSMQETDLVPNRMDAA
jgi:Ca-activated chloride channel family protein